MSGIDGSRVVVTGPTSGIGREITRRLAASGAEVVLACRDAARGERTAREISATASTAPPAVMVLDTSSRASILRFAQEYRRS